MLESFRETALALQVVTGSERVAGVDADAHPALVLHPVDDICQLLERITEVGTLPRRILDDGAHTPGLVQRQVDGFGDGLQALLVAHLFQRTARMEIQQLQPQLLATLHLIQKSGTRLLQSLLLGTAQVNQITVVRKDVVRRISVSLAPLAKQADAPLRERRGHPLPLILGKQGKRRCPYLLGILGSILHSTRSADMRTYVFSHR